MKKKVILLILTFLFIPSVYAEKIEVKFSKCVDGDTARFILNKEEIKVRFIGINTPESVNANSEVEEYGIESSEYTCKKLKNASKIEIEYEENSDKLDKYGRTLAYVFVDDKLLETLILKKGYGTVKYVKNNYKYIDELLKAEEYAKNKKLGIYSDKEEKEIDEISDTVANIIQKYINKILAKIFG